MLPPNAFRLSGPKMRAQRFGLRQAKFTGYPIYGDAKVDFQRCLLNCFDLLQTAASFLAFGCCNLWFWQRCVNPTRSNHVLITTGGNAERPAFRLLVLESRCLPGLDLWVKQMGANFGEAAICPVLTSPGAGS